jgi:hypothetical protein
MKVITSKVERRIEPIIGQKYLLDNKKVECIKQGDYYKSFPTNKCDECCMKIAWSEGGIIFSECSFPNGYTTVCHKEEREDSLEVIFLELN